VILRLNLVFSFSVSLLLVSFSLNCSRFHVSWSRGLDSAKIPMPSYLHCLIKHPNIFDCNLKKDYRIFIVFGKNISETSGYQIIM